MNQPLPGIVWIQFLAWLRNLRRRFGPEVDVDRAIGIGGRTGVACSPPGTAGRSAGSSGCRRRRRRPTRSSSPGCSAGRGDDSACRRRGRRRSRRAASTGTASRCPRASRPSPGHANGDVGEAGAAVGVDVALRVPAGRPADERPLPGAIGVDEPRRVL